MLGPERYRAEVERRQDDLRSAQHDLSEALTANLVLGQAGARRREQLVADWPTLTINEKRAVVRPYIDRVIVERRPTPNASAGSRPKNACQSAGPASQLPRRRRAGPARLTRPGAR